MKILLLGPHPPHGGGSAYSSQELACGLRRLGHDVLQLAPYRSATGLVEYPGLIWIPADCSWDTLSLSPALKAEVEHQLLTAYLTHGPFDYVILGREFFLWHLPTIRRIHQNPIVLICRGGHINRLAAGEPTDSELRTQLLDLYRGCDLIVCIASYLVELVNRVAGVDTAVFLPNPINLSAYNVRTAIQPVSGQPLQLLMGAQLKTRKRPLDAVEIVRLLHTQGTDCHLTVCGEGPLLGEMVERIRHYGLEAQISLKGRVERQDVLELMNQVETVLLCSESEGRPRVLQEAIALGKGIVAYDNPGSREVIQEWSAQWPHAHLVPIGDTVAASQAILELAQSFRSKSEPLLPPQLPKPLTVLQQYEALLKTLSVQPLKAVSSLESDLVQK